MWQVIDSGFAWDPANFVQVGELHPTTDGWPLLGSYVSHVHVKDALVNGEVQTAGNGDGEVKQLLERLAKQTIRVCSRSNRTFVSQGTAVVSVAQMAWNVRPRRYAN